MQENLSKNLFNKRVRTQLEKAELDIPEYTDEYLRERFGDYMNCPQKESTCAAKHICKWDVDKDFSEYVSNPTRGYFEEYKLGQNGGRNMMDKCFSAIRRMDRALDTISKNTGGTRLFCG